MTREELENMTSEQINHLVQENIFGCPPSHTWERDAGDYNQCVKCSKIAFDSEAEILESDCEYPDPYSTWIASAWNVVESDGHWEISKSVKYQAAYSPSDRMKSAVLAIAETAPLAICRAALLAVMAE